MSRLLVLSGHSGPLDRRIVAEVNTLAASGRSVTLVNIPADIQATCLDQRVRVVMQSTGSVGRRYVLKRVLRKLPVRLGKLARTAWHLLNPGPLPALRQYFLQVTPREKFDVIHCHDLDTLPAAVELREKISPNAKLIYDSHELFPFQFTRRWFQKYWLNVEEQYIRAADLIITINASISQELARLYDIDRPAVIYNSYGVFRQAKPLEESGFLQHFGASTEGFRLIFQGTYVPEKNLVALLKAFGMLGAATQLFLLGGGPMEVGLRKLCKKLRLPNVFFGAWVPQEDLLSYVAHAHLGIIPYSGREILNNRYCTPNKLFEFIAAEIPICASDLPELRRIVKENGIGDVYTMDDPAAIASAIEDCCAQCARRAFSLSALRAAREKFAWDKQGKKLVALYDKLGV